MNKKAIFSSLLLAFTSIATANHGGSGGLIGLISNFPFPVDNWRQIAISAATFALIWFTVYMITKKLIMRFELEDLFNMGGGTYGDDGRNLGAVLSLLIVVSAAGASHTYLGFTIDTIQQTLLLAVGFLVASLIILVLGGGAGLFMFSTGKAAKAGAWGLNELDEGANAGSDEYDNQDIEAVRDRTTQAQDVATRAEHEEEDVTSGQSEDPEQESDQAAHDVEKVIELVESSEKTLSGMMKKDLDEFEQAIEDAQRILKQDQKEEKGVKDIKARLDDVNNELNKANSSLENSHENNLSASGLGKGATENQVAPGGFVDSFKGLKTIDEELKGVQEDIKLIESLETKEEEEMEDEVHILVNKLEEFIVLQNLLSRIKQEIGEAEQLDEYLESISQEMGSEKVYKEAEQEEKEIEQMKSYYQELMSEEQRLEELIERAKDLIKNEIKLEEEEIQQLQTLVKEDGRILNQIEALEKNVLENIGDSDYAPQAWRRMENMQDNLNKIGEHLEKIEQQNEQEEAAEERLLNKFADL